MTSWRENLHTVLDAIRPPQFPDNDFPVTDFGAIGDGRTDCRPAFAHAIRACSEAGGGRVIVPSGEFLVNGPIVLMDGVNLHLEAVASTIRFGTHPRDYLVGSTEHNGGVLVSWEGTWLYNYSPAIYARNCTNIGITGAGTIDQQGSKSWCTWRARQGKSRTLTREVNNKRVPVEQRLFGAKYLLRPHMVELISCDCALIEGVTLRDAGFWMVHPVLCTNVTVRGIAFNSMHLNNDGVDPESCENVLIEDIDFSNGDDNVSIKAGRDQDGLQSKPCRGVVVRNCRFAGHNAMTIGSEMSGGVEDVYVYGCHAKQDVLSALHIKSNIDRGGYVRRIYMWELRFRHAKHRGVHITSNYKNEGSYRRPPSISDVHIEDVTIDKTDKEAIYVHGVSDQPIRSIHLRNVHIARAPQATVCRHAEDIVFDNVTVNGKPCVPPQHTPMTW